ncbi:hypothetical protein DXG03_006446 [Asterophora parasitica]|uniref:Uncharacterized protein n=1 Tax=Asterophora parasitica TaxID=117018 RepID=A0A9P7G5Q1_9AGAR|nr:hypothetical protein DXG03_006446 [Asterophora parasitica]
MPLGQDEHLDVLFHTLQKICHEENIDYRVIGGAAFYLHGRQRGTKDVDIELLTQDRRQKLAAGFREIDDNVVKDHPDKGIMVKYKWGPGKHDFCGLDGKIAPAEELDIWREHFVIIQGYPVADLHVLLVTKIRAAASRRKWERPIKGVIDIGDVRFCTYELAQSGIKFDPSTLPLITEELYAEFLNRVEEEDRPIVVQALQAIGFPRAE